MTTPTTPKPQGQMNVSMEDLLRIIGDKEVMLTLLRSENAQLRQQLDALNKAQSVEAIGKVDTAPAAKPVAVPARKKSA